jgi:hypothetical protein
MYTGPLVWAEAGWAAVEAKTKVKTRRRRERLYIFELNSLSDFIIFPALRVEFEHIFGGFLREIGRSP